MDKKIDISNERSKIFWFNLFVELGIKTKGQWVQENIRDKYFAAEADSSSSQWRICRTLCLKMVADCLTSLLSSRIIALIRPPWVWSWLRPFDWLSWFTYTTVPSMQKLTVIIQLQKMLQHKKVPQESSTLHKKHASNKKKEPLSPFWSKQSQRLNKSI